MPAIPGRPGRRSDHRVHDHPPLIVARAVFGEGDDIGAVLDHLSAAGFPRAGTAVEDAHGMEFRVFDQQVRDDLHRAARWSVIESLSVGILVALALALLLASATTVSWELPLGVVLGAIGGGLATWLAGLLTVRAERRRQAYAHGATVVTVRTIRPSRARDVLLADGGTLVVPDGARPRRIDQPPPA